MFVREVLLTILECTLNFSLSQALAASLAAEQEGLADDQEMSDAEPEEAVQATQVDHPMDQEEEEEEGTLSPITLAMRAAVSQPRPTPTPQPEPQPEPEPEPTPEPQAEPEPSPPPIRVRL